MNTDIELIEGYEGPILHGAMNTIKKYTPLIVVEIGYNHGKKFKWPKGKVIEFLGELGYSPITNFGKDHVFKYQE